MAAEASTKGLRVRDAAVVGVEGGGGIGNGGVDAGVSCCMVFLEGGFLLWGLVVLFCFALGVPSLGLSHTYVLGLTIGILSSSVYLFCSLVASSRGDGAGRAMDDEEIRST